MSAPKTALTFHIVLEYPADDEPVRGHISSDGQPARPFEGWLGLVETLEALRGERETGDAGGV